MATYLEILNNVQRRLRETVSSEVENTDYDNLLGIFIDDAKRQFEDTYPWQRYKSVISVATQDDDDTLDLANNTSQRTRVLHAWNTTSADPILKYPMETILRNRLASTVTKGSVVGYNWGGADSTDGTAEIHLYPRSDGAQTLKFWIYNPPVDLRGQAKGTFYDGPAHVIELGAYLRAITERGEVGGASYQVAKLDYDKSVSDLLGYEEQLYGGFDWRNEWGADNLYRGTW